MGKRKHTGVKHGLLPFICLIVVAAYAAWCFVQPLTTIEPTNAFKSSTIAAQKVSLKWPAYGQAAIGATGYGVLGTQGKQTALPTASVAKVITALAVLRQRPLHLGDQGPTITITQQDVDSYHSYVGKDGSVVGVALGEQISEYQALEAMLLPSANNMADTLARWAFGSIDKYNAYANTYAQELGLKSVKVTDPSGLLPTTVASAHDLTILGELAMQNPVIAQIVALPSASIPIQGTVSNYNFLLGDDHNVGIKTGNNDQDPGVYLFAFKVPAGQSTVMIVGAIMGGPNLPQVLKDAKALYLSTVPHFKELNLVKSGDAIGSYQPDGQQPATAVASQSLDLVLWDGYAFSSKARLTPLHATTPSGTAVGSIAVSNDTKHVTNSVPVILKQTVKQPPWTSRLRHPY